jgi:hypothetical protein
MLVSRVTQRSYERFDLLADDGTEQPYFVPHRTGGDVLLPKQFFLNGWHLVLEPRELVMYLAICDAQARARHPGGVILAEASRALHYCISGEVYGAIHELDEFGLIKVVDPMPHRRRGRVRPPREPLDDGWAPLPYRLQLRSRGLTPNAYDTVRTALTTHPTPPNSRG